LNFFPLTLVSSTPGDMGSATLTLARHLPISTSAAQLSERATAQPARPAWMAVAGISPHWAWAVQIWGVVLSSAGWRWAPCLYLASVGGGRFLDVPLGAEAAAVVVSSAKEWSVLVVAGGSGACLVRSGVLQCGGLGLWTRWCAADLIPVKWSWPLSGVAAPVAVHAAFSGSAMELPWAWVRRGLRMR
jgi:hypothetical protein